MKWIWMSLALITASASAYAQEGTQPGTPALLESFNGKQARVFLQSYSDGKLTFQAYRATRNVTVNASRVRKLTFHTQWDVSELEALFNNAQYDEVITFLEPKMGPYIGYMAIDNNLRPLFAFLMDAYLKVGRFDRVSAMAGLLMDSNDERLEQKALVAQALAAIEEGNLEDAVQLQEQVTSEAAKLYLQASIEKAQGQSKTAIRTVSNIIINHANDLEWLGPSELLCAHIYMDMLNAEDSVITTNSPMYTARQVMNIYNGTAVSAEARILWASLGGEAVEAERQAAKEEEKRLMAEKEAEMAERRKQREAEEAAKAAAGETDAAPAEVGDGDGSGAEAPETDEQTDVTTETEDESE